MSTITSEIDVTDGVFEGGESIESWNLTNPLFNPLLLRQWYLGENGQGGSIGATDVSAAWAEATGLGVSIGVIDAGFQLTHADLLNRMTSIGTSLATASQDHGTQVSGVLGANAYNSFGIAGVAYDATMQSIALNFASANPTRAQVAAALQQGALSDVVNSSWGYRTQFSDNFLDSRWVDVKSAITGGAANGRDGLGSIWVFAAGNDRQYIAGSTLNDGDNTNYHSLTNARQIITVAASDDQGRVTAFSTPGASVFAAAPGVSIFTTGVTDPAVTQDQGFEYAAGTSFSAPIVSGVVALMLEVNPELGYRDVQSILAITSTRTGSLADWTENGASGWNGGGYLVNQNLGFGVVDAEAAVRLARHWELSSTAHNEEARTLAAIETGPRAFADGTQMIQRFQLQPGSADIKVEWAELDVAITHAHIGDLTITLTSPSGTVSTLVARPGAGANSTDNLTFTLTSAHLRGEDAAGMWTATITDARGNGGGTLQQAGLRLFGARASEDTTHVFTDDFGKLAARSVIGDTLGHDEMIFAAMDSGVSVDLGAGSAVIAGRSVTVAEGARIDRIIGSYHGDRIILAAQSGRIEGLAGNDTLFGADGDDTLVAGEGDDMLSGGGGANRLDGGTGVDIVDYGASRVGILLSLDSQLALHEAGRLDQMSGIEGVQASAFADSLYGNDAANLMKLGAGNDGAVGGGGDDTMLGEAGDDWMAGDAGDDLLDGGDGIDVLWGGAGNDTLQAGSGEANWLMGGAGDDLLRGGSGTDVLAGDEDNDTLSGEDAMDALYGGEGDDSLDGGAGDDWVFGGYGADVIKGGFGNDALFGDAGNDTMEGGQDGDWMWGGDGNDTFIVRAGLSDADVIADFQGGLGAGDVLFIHGSAYRDAAAVLAGAVQIDDYLLIPVDGQTGIYLHQFTKSQLALDDIFLG